MEVLETPTAGSNNYSNNYCNNYSNNYSNNYNYCKMQISHIFWKLIKSCEIYERSHKIVFFMRRRIFHRCAQMKIFWHQEAKIFSPVFLTGSLSWWNFVAKQSVWKLHLWQKKSFKIIKKVFLFRQETRYRYVRK